MKLKHKTKEQTLQAMLGKLIKELSVAERKAYLFGYNKYCIADFKTWVFESKEQYNKSCLVAYEAFWHEGRANGLKEAIDAMKNLLRTGSYTNSAGFEFDVDGGD